MNYALRIKLGLAVKMVKIKAYKANHTSSISFRRSSVHTSVPSTC